MTHTTQATAADAYRLERLRAKIVEDAAGCWLWQGQKSKRGYGRLSVYGRRWMAHRIMYTLVVGPIPDGLELDHLCRVKSCINPAHLEPVTHGENIRRGTAWHHLAAENAAKTACPQGHPYSPENTYRSRNGDRRCRTCSLANSRRYAAKNRYRIADRKRAKRQGREVAT